MSGRFPYVYVIVTVALTVVLPAVSVGIEAAQRPDAALVDLIGRWFVFWGGGVRLLLAAATQIAKPGVTTRILGLGDPAAEKLVSELGIANLALGSVAAASLALPAWLPPAAVGAGGFLLLAGAKHALNPGRSVKESVAMVTDLVVGVAAFVYLASGAA